MTDTSKEMTNSTWVNDACELFDQHSQELGWQRHIYSDNLRALLSERDALRVQLQTARDEALEKAASWYSREGWLLDEMEVPDAIRAFKSTSAKASDLKFDHPPRNGTRINGKSQ